MYPVSPSLCTIVLFNSKVKHRLIAWKEGESGIVAMIFLKIHDCVLETQTQYTTGFVGGGGGD